jgi:hypothetical protein
MTRVHVNGVAQNFPHCDQCLASFDCHVVLFVPISTYYVSFHALFSCYNNISLGCEIVVTYHLMCYFLPEH